jgi:hypothetical protein
MKGLQIILDILGFIFMAFAPWLILGALLLIASGCASTVVTSTPRTVLFKNSYGHNAAQRQALADAECLKHGRWAIHRPDNTPDGYTTYECIE